MQQGPDEPASARGPKLRMLAVSLAYALIFTLILASARLDSGHAAAKSTAVSLNPGGAR